MEARQGGEHGHLPSRHWRGRVSASSHYPGPLVNNPTPSSDIAAAPVLVRRAQLQLSIRLLLMQGHVDMVTEKNSDVQHDFFTDGIKLRREGDWLKVPNKLPLCTAVLSLLLGGAEASA